MGKTNLPQKCIIYHLTMNNCDLLGFAPSDKWDIFPANITYFRWKNWIRQVCILVEHQNHSNLHQSSSVFVICLNL